MVLPLSGTNLKVYTNVPFQSDYKHVRWFNTISEQSSYFLGRAKAYETNTFNFQKLENNMIVKVPRNIENLRNVTYLSFINTNDGNKPYYCFVDRIEYIQQNTTYLHISLDVLQTYRFDFSIKPSQVLREHQTEFTSTGRPITNNLNEGLDYGTEYETVNATKIRPYENIRFMVIICKNAIHNGANDITPVRLGGVAQPLTYYFLPYRPDGNAVNVTNKDGNTFNLSTANVILNKLYSSEDAVNNVVDIHVTEYIGINFDLSSDMLTQAANSGSSIESGDIDGATLMWVTNVNSFDYKELNAGDVFNFGRNDVGKLLNSPYSIITIDDFKGNRIDIKPEYIDSGTLTLIIRGGLLPNNRTSYSVKNYNISVVGEGLIIGLSQETELVNNNPQDIPIVAEYLSAYMQGNRNSIRNQKAQIGFNQSMGMVNSAIGGISAGATSNYTGVASSIGGAIQGQGNSFFALKGINAKIQDVSNIPPSLIKAGGDVAYDYGNFNDGVRVMWKQIKSEYYYILRDFFKMFGYRSSRIKTPNLRTRNNFNYIQTQSIGLFGEIPNDDLIKLRGIFDNGVTLWHTNDLGNYDLENEVR